MALHSQQVVVGNTATALYPVDTDGVELTVSANKDIYIGNSDLSNTTGFLLAKDTVLCLSLGPGEQLFGLTSNDNVTAFVLATKNA